MSDDNKEGAGVPVAWQALPYANASELLAAFKAGTAFDMHYHGDVRRVTAMGRHVSGTVAVCAGPMLPVIVRFDGFYNGNAPIWLALATPPTASPLVAHESANVSDNISCGSSVIDNAHAVMPAAPSDAVRGLGRRLAELLDEDHWAECEPLLLGIETAPRALFAKWRHAAEHLGLEGLASLSDCADELEAALSQTMQPQAESENGYCVGCGGSGEQTFLSGGGPDAYDEIGNCQRCEGTGAEPAAGEQAGAVAPKERCPNCDDTGDVNSITGEWRGVCHCPAGQAINNLALAAPGAAIAAREQEVSDAMVDAYLKANDAYWKRTDELPKSGVKWRNGTPREATRESLIAALASRKEAPATPQAPSDVAEAAEKLMSLGCKAAIGESRFRDDWLKAVEDMRAALTQPATVQQADQYMVIGYVVGFDTRIYDKPAAGSMPVYARAALKGMQPGERKEQS